MKKILLVIFSLSILAGGGIYFYIHKSSTNKIVEEVFPSSIYTTKVSGYTLSLLKNGTEIQTLTLGEDAVAGMNLTSGTTDAIAPFITNKDVTFDSYADVAMITGIGYGGVNLFYDYYIFDPNLEQLVLDPVLIEISNPIFDPVKKTITGSAKEGPDVFSTVYSWKNTRYVKGQTISETTGEVQVDQ